MRTISTHRLIVALALAMAYLPLTVLGQEIANPEDYYPLEVGSLWQHSIRDLSLWPDSIIVTTEVVGDTLMPNGHVYKRISHRSDSTEYRRNTWALAAWGAYQRLDTTKAVVYTYDLGKNEERAALWLDIAPDLVPLPDETANPYVFRFDDLEQRRVFGQVESVLVGWEFGNSDADLDRDVLLARGIGTFDIYEFGGAPLNFEHVRLLYANVNGREYGEKVATTVGDATEVPSTVELRSNYPDPFSVSTNIPFNIPEFSRVRVTVYDLRGREIAVLFEGGVGPGQHTVKWKPAEVSSGVYLCELEAGNVRKSQLLVYLN